MSDWKRCGEENPAFSPPVPAYGEEVKGAADGYVRMPTRLTAENGAKAALMGEFSERVVMTCECGGEDSDCPNCNGEGEWVYTFTVGWATIKNIYEKAVQLLGT